jgi:hypothetical protein
MKFSLIYFPRIGNRREQSGNWIHAKKNLIYGIASNDLFVNFGVKFKKIILQNKSQVTSGR